VYRYLDRRQAHLVIGFPGTTLDDPDRYALEVLATVLGGQSGRLFSELRERRGLAYRVGMISVEGIDPGYVAAYLACTPENLEEAVTAVKTELQRVIDDGVSQPELRRAVRYLIGTHEIARQRRSSQAAAIALHEAYGLGYDEYRRYEERMKAITPEDVQRVARQYLDWEVAVTATVKPPDLTPGLMRRTGGGREARPGASR
jgi:zinc protease